MSTTDIAPSAYPHVAAWKLEICREYGRLLTNTGGNPPEELLEDLSDPANTRFAATNVVRFTLAVAVEAQVSLIARLQEAGLLP